MYKKLPLFLILASSFALTACGGSDKKTEEPKKINQAPTILIDDVVYDTFGRRTIDISVSGSDQENDPLSYIWVQSSPTNIALDLSQVSDEGKLTLTLPDVAEDTVFELNAEVSDGESTDSKDVTINVAIANADPLSKISGKNIVSSVIHWPSANIENISTLKTNGSIGTNPQWSVKSFPDNSQYKLTSSSTTVTGFYADTIGDYTIQLIVDNEQGITNLSEYTVSVVADADGDGTLDADDLDLDNDGYLNTEDLFDNDKASHADTDGDGVSNYHQADEDGDGVDDHNDQYPFDKTKSEIAIFEEPIETNTNDGISVAVTVGEIPTSIIGELSSVGGYDQDYYQVELAKGRVTIIAQTSDNAKPILALVTSKGNQAPYIDVELPKSTASASINGVIGEAGTYYVVIGNSISETISYNISINYDADQDGLPDDLEIAIDSNPNSIDSDNDGINDGVEYFSIPTELHDIDNDGLPAWWDLDTDGDFLADSIEVNESTLKDIDNDGLINSVDTDSDNNQISDADESGFDFNQPTDTDNDGTPDYIDLDNDGDFVSDVTDNNPLVRIENDAILNGSDALSVLNITFNDEAGNQFVKNSKIVINIKNADVTSDLEVILVKGNSEAVSLPHVRDGDALTVILDDSIVGTYNIMVSDGVVVSGNYGIYVIEEDAPTITSLEVNGDYINFKGTNYNQHLVIHYPEGTVTLNNSTWNSEDTLSVSMPIDFTGGEVYISGDSGTTDTFIINKKRDYEVTVTIVPVTNMLLGDLFIMSSKEDDIPLSTGQGKIQTNARKPEVITVLTYVNDKPNAVGYAPVLTTASNIEVNSTTTGLGYLWFTINYDWNLDDADTVFESLYQLDEVVAFGAMIYLGLENDVEYMSSSDVYSSEEYKNAVLAINEALPKVVEAASTNPIVGPDETIDNISVFIDSKGTLSYSNDTMLFLSYQITDENDGIVCDYGSGFPDANYISPQFGKFKNARIGPFCDAAQNGGNLKVRFLTAGVDNEFKAKQSVRELTLTEQIVRVNLVGRTIIDGVVVPFYMGLLGAAGATDINKGFVRALIVSNAHFVISESTEYALGNQNFKTFKSDLLDHMEADLQDPNGLASELIKRAFKGSKTEVVIKKLLEKVAKAMIPFVGPFLALWDNQDLVFAGIDIGNTVSDLISRDVVIDFTTIYPLTLESISPSIVSPDGQPKTFTLTGTGFSPASEERTISNWFPETLPPIVIFTEKATGDSVTAEPVYMSGDGSELRVNIRGDFFMRNYANYTVQIKHQANAFESEILNPGVEVGKGLILESILPSNASLNDKAEISGTGFSTNASSNTLMIGEREIVVLASTSNGIKFTIPFDLTEGTYQVKVGRNDIVDSDWSNELTLVISLSPVTIRVCDNGRAKDDNFALDVNGIRVGQTNTTRNNYCFLYPVTAIAGNNVARLTGLDAPDGIGTYSITFMGVESVNGDRTIGDDLIPGSAPKVYYFTTPTSTGQQSATVISLSVPTTYSERK
jgi:hypothetical protein